RAAADHRHVDGLAAGVVGNARVVDVDRDALQRHGRPGGRKPGAEHQAWSHFAHRAPERIARHAELHRQLARDEDVAGDLPAVERAHRLQAGIARGVAERAETRQQDLALGMALRVHRNTMKYISAMLQASSGSAVATCWRITALGSFSSSSAAGTRLKLAAIGVSRVPQ